jgi:hypothetical protein
MIAGAMQFPSLLADRCVVTLLLDLGRRELTLPRDDHQGTVERHGADAFELEQFGLGILKICDSAKLGSRDASVPPGPIPVDQKLDVQQPR